MENQFVVGVADVRLYDDEGILVLSSKTMLNSSMEISTGSTEISGGKRNKLLNVYYHSGRLNLTLEDTVFNLEWLRDNAGGEWCNYAKVLHQTSFTTKAGENTIPDDYPTPEALDGNTDVYVYINQNSYKLTGKKFMMDEDDENTGKNVCLEYYITDDSAESYTIPAAIMPKRLRAILNVDIASNKQGEGVVGQLLIEVPVLQLSGAQTINMTSDGYSSTPLSGMALAYTPSGSKVGCGNKDIYAIVTKQIYDTKWYTDVIALAVMGGETTLDSFKGESKEIELIAIKQNGETRPVVWADIEGEVGAGLNGVTVSGNTITATNNATGSGNVTFKIKYKTSVDAIITVNTGATPTTYTLTRGRW